MMNITVIIGGNLLLLLGLLIGFFFWRLSIVPSLQRPFSDFLLVYTELATGALLAYAILLSTFIGYLTGYSARTNEDTYGAIVPATFFLLVIGWHFHSSSVGYVFEHFLNLTALAVYCVVIISGFLGGGIRRLIRVRSESSV